MAKRVEGVSERILACAKEEFLNEGYTYQYMGAVGRPDKLGDALTEKLMHIVTTSRFESLFEVIRHDMSREEAAEYIRLLSKYHRTGFFAVFGTVME